MGLSPVVKTQLPIPTHVSAASLQNPAETQESLIFLPFVICFFPYFHLPLPLVLGTQLYYHLSHIKLFSRACSVYTRNSSYCKLPLRFSKHRYVNCKAVRKVTTRAGPAPLVVISTVGRFIKTPFSPCRAVMWALEAGGRQEDALALLQHSSPLGSYGHV